MTTTISMKRNITLLNAVSIILGSIIGSGIFVSPGGVLKHAGGPTTALFIWALCGVMCTIGAVCFSELGTMLPAAGGEYNYILQAFGGLPAFLTLWVNVLVIRPATQAVVALAFAEYALALVFPNCDAAPRVAVVLLAILALATLTYINCVSIRLAMNIQTLFTTAKLTALVMIIISGSMQLRHGTATHFNSFETEAQSIGGISLSLYSGLFAYAGWHYVNVVTEELKEPQKNLPRSIYIAMPIVTCTYVLVNAAYFIVLTPEEVATSDAVAVLFGQRALGYLRYTVPVFVALSTFGTLNGTLFTSGRLFLAGAREGHLPKVLSFINIKARTPTPALLLTCFVSILMVNFKILFLINCLSFVLWLSIGAATASLLWLRRSQPHLPRPIKVPVALPIFFLSCCIFLIVVPVVIEPESTGLGLLVTLSGIPVYFVGVKWQMKPKWMISLYESFERLIQKCLMVVAAEVQSKDVGYFVEGAQKHEKNYLLPE